MVQVEVLGRPAVRVDGERIELRGRQPALLAALVLAAPRPVASDTLLEAVWAARLPRDPANALQQRISELRRRVDPTQTGAVLVTVAGGYALHLDDQQIDARRFARLVGEGRDLLVAGDVEVARERLGAALGRWRGPAFEGLADEPWLVPEVHRLNELRLTAIEDRIEADLALGRGSELVAELTELTATHPLRERLAAQLMRAQYRAGRQADALATYERIRTQLADELGVDPGPALARVHLQVLRQADDLEVTALSAPRQAPRTTNLPAPTRVVIGRDAAIERAAQLLTVSRLVTLTGPAGAGKTTLALETARRQPVPDDGTWLVELAPLNDADEVTDALARAVGVQDGATPLSAESLVEVLQDRSVLLVLDNAEHLIDEVASLVHALLTRAPQLQVLTTSRAPLGVDGELVWSVPALALPDEDEQALDPILAAPAVQLLVERLGAHSPGVELDVDDARAAATIVRRLDGIPLAIELAAARARVLSLPELAEALDDRFSVLRTTRPTGPSRQRTLRAAIDGSWDLLDASLRASWAALSVPATSAEVGLAAELLDAAGVDAPALEVLGALADRSLLTLDTSTAPTRYRMLESLRAYGHDRLRELGLDVAVRTRHADAVAAALAACHDRSDPRVFGVDLEGQAAWLDEATAALHGAADRGDLGRVQQLAGALGWLWLLRGLVPTGIRWLTRGLGAADGAPPAGFDLDAADPQAVLWLSGLLATGGSPHGPAWAALSLEAELDPDQRVLAELFAGAHRAHAGEVEAALDDLEAAADRARKHGGWVLGFAHLVTAQIGRVSGRLDDVLRHVRAALEPLTDAGADWARVQAIDLLIDGLGPAADPKRTRRLASEGLALCRRQQLPELEGRMLLQLGVATHAAGDLVLAARYLAEAVELTARANRGPSLGFALLISGAHARQRGELDLALDQLTAARHLFADTAMTYGATRAAVELGLTRLERGEELAAAVLAAEAARLSTSLQDPDLRGQVQHLVSATGAEGELLTDGEQLTNGEQLTDR